MTTHNQRVHLVISRHDEDVDWVHEVLATLAARNCVVTVFVYDKGASTLDARALLEGAPGVAVRQTRLPNVGRESHTYLAHVLQTRSDHTGPTDPTGVTVFMQGRMSDHVPSPHASVASFVDCMVREAAESLLGESSNHACHTQYGAFNAVPGLKVAMYPGVGDSGMDLGGWFSAFVRPWCWSSVDSGPTWWQHGVFAIRTCRTLKNRGRVGDAYYQSLQAQVDWHVNPEAGHFFERAWYFVFPLLNQSENDADEETGYDIVGEYGGNAEPGAPKTDDSP